MFDLLSIEYDGRVKAHSISARLSYAEYLSFIDAGFEELKIQRALIKGNQAYQTLKKDLTKGCLMPSIVLAVDDFNLPKKPNFSSYEEEILFLDGIKKKLHQAMSVPLNLSILDGQQRTKALQDVSEALKQGDLFSSNRKQELKRFESGALRVEIWIGLSFGALAYRMLLLNAGQKPMSIKHQIEVINHRFEKEIKASIDNINLIKSLKDKSSSAPNTYKLSGLAQGLYAWMQGTPHIDLRATVMDTLLADEAIDNLTHQGPMDEPSVKQYIDFIKLICDIGDLSNNGKEVNSFFNKDTVIQSVSAAISASRSDIKVSKKLNNLKELYRKKPGGDHLALGVFNELKPTLDPRLFNVGYGTREWIYRVFLRFFNGDDDSLSNIWRKELKALTNEKHGA